VLWRPKDTSEHTHTMVRLIRASGDYISQYHEETRDAYARAHDVDFDTGATSITGTGDIDCEHLITCAPARIPWIHAVEWSHDIRTLVRSLGYKVRPRR